LDFLPFLRFRDKSCFCVGLSSLCQPLAVLEDRGFLSALSCQVPILKKNSLSSFACLNRKHVGQGPWRGYACMRIGRNKWHFLRSVRKHPSARCLSTGLHTTPSASFTRTVSIHF
jgi:hypothetical protein